MNVTELSRQLRVNAAEMFDRLPALGFDIGRKAIKIDDRIALRIIEAWNRNEKKTRELSKINEIRSGAKEEEKAEAVINTEVTLPNIVTVREFASILNLPVNKVLSELMKNGIFISINERLDFETASIIGENLGYTVKAQEKTENVVANDASQQKLKEILQHITSETIARPPVIVVMGHVDHGKTKLLDYIRKTDVVAGESGGITQHIGAYQVHRNGKILTFIDTPGHEAFTAMRSRGAQVADMAILVIAADDGIQPQTKEAIKIIQNANLPFVVAINKCDKSEANIDKVKSDLSAVGLLPEDWGGKVICTPVSALSGLGVNDLLDTMLLMSEIDKLNLSADPTRLAIGSIVESHMDKGEGPVATILVQSGTLRVGDILSVGNFYFGKVRMLKDYKGQVINEAIPGMPAKIIGLKLMPNVGDVMEVVMSAENLEKDINKRKSNQEKDFSTIFSRPEQENDKTKYINLVIKADVLGSLEAIIESLMKLETEEIKIKIVGKGLGIITESDIQKAEMASAKVFGFKVKPVVSVANLARDKKVNIKFYDVIYHLIEDIEDEMKLMKEKVIKRELFGKLQILKVFRKENKTVITGGRVIEGSIGASQIVIVVRNGEPITVGAVNRVECTKQVIDKVESGKECGILFEGKPLIEEGDVLEFYKETEVEAKPETNDKKGKKRK